MPEDRGRTRVVDERAEAALIVASSHDAIVGMTRHGEITSCNPAAARMYGCSARDIVGHDFREFVAPGRWDPDAALLGRIVAGEVLEQYRTEWLAHDGTVIKVLVSISPIVGNPGTIIGAATAARRVSGLQQAHDRFEIRTDERRAGLHEAAERLQNRADKHRAGVRDAAIRFEAQVDAQRQEAVDAAERFEVQVDAQRREALAAADRTEAEVSAERQQARGAAAEFEAQVAQERVDVRAAQLSSDLELDFERAEVERDKEHLQAQLQQSQRLEVLGQLAGGVAHDFNNLLAVILNYAAFVTEEMALGPDADLETAGRDVAQIQRAAQRAAALTHQLLAFARREIVQPMVLDLNAVVAEVKQLLDRTIGEDVVLRTELAGDLWPILADVGQLEQVLVNLAINARDAMGGGGTLTIDTANVTIGAETSAAGSPLRAGPHVRLRVADTGSGMPAEVIAHVFEPFYTTKPDGTGTGLGLATVYGIVLQAEGTIDIQSEPGAGTTFTIVIPVTDEVAAPVAVEPVVPRPGAGETVLIVEDEEALREVTERIFTRGGYRVLTAAHGAEALAVAAAHDGEIHLLVTDVVMPNMLGKEVAERVVLIRPGIEVLYMSGYAQPVLAAQGRLDRDVHLIEKPFSAAALIAEAGRILHDHSSAR